MPRKTVATCQTTQDRLRGRQANFRGADRRTGGRPFRLRRNLDYGEIRVYAIGLVNGLEITVIYTDRDGDERHIISAWRSEPHERRHYWQNIEAAQDRH